MRQALINATDAAIRTIDVARFYQTERGFHGRFYCALQAELDRLGLMSNGAILEMEYQKSTRHGMRQRPDIIFHIPTEYSNVNVKANNYAVWALKRQASVGDAVDDFRKLDQMFGGLMYPLGFFVNIDANDPMLEHYTGVNRNSLVAVAARFSGAQVSVHWAHPDC